MIKSYFLLAAAWVPAPDHSVAANRVVVTDIELSEFTPVRQLHLDIDSGLYSIDAPDVAWPGGYPRPPKRSGKMPEDRLSAVRTAFVEASSATLSDQKCVAVNGRGFPIYVSNAPVPHMSLTDENKRLSSSALWACWTPQARRLFQQLESDFSAFSDRRIREE